MKKLIFVSHSSKDKDLVEAIVDLIEEGIGVAENQIFCSSLKGYGIPVGENFISYIKNQIQAPKIVILVLTPSYFKSNFCLCELGAAWAMSHKIYPILVPPLGFDDVKDVLTGVQALNVDDDISYNELRDYLGSDLGVKIKTSTKWDIKRKKFLSKLKIVLKEIEVPNEISFDEHKVTLDKYNEALDELENYESEIDSLKEYINELESCKDAYEVKKAKIKNKKTINLQEKFDQIIGNICSIGENLSGEVFKFILSDYYGKPYKIDLFSYGDSFNEAERYNYISTDDGADVNWNNRNLTKLSNYLSDLNEFFEEYDEDTNKEMNDFLNAYEEQYDSPPEPNNQEFWEEHYSI